MSPTHVTTWDETRLLDYFWACIRDEADRIAALRQLADVVLPRPSEWDEWAVRQAMAGVKMTLTADRCFACRTEERHIYWHHIIQVQHGGSSTPRNLVPLCHRCHRLVHPWLPEPTSRENRRGWTWVGDVAVRALDKLEAMWDARREARKRGELE